MDNQIPPDQKVQRGYNPKAIAEDAVKCWTDLDEMSQPTSTLVTYEVVLHEHLRFLGERRGRGKDFESNKSLGVIIAVCFFLGGICVEPWIRRLSVELALPGLVDVCRVYGGFWGAIGVIILWRLLRKKFDPDAANFEYSKPKPPPDGRMW